LKHCFILLRDLDSKKIGAEVFGELRNVVLEENGEDKIEKLTNKLLERTGEKKLQNNILCTKVNWIAHILRRNCLLHDAIERQMLKVKGVGRTRNRQIYWR
jgi:hypothetical protein